jgi:bifunctional UDP-N-acetylglucosamine pyrophosphorylase/glucosamine-1-phosphate N-acetyltransferase
VEIKKSVIGEGTKVSHMTYIGDGVVGKNCNIGCGVIFCNYDGKEKHQTTIGDNVFVGSNSCLIAPLTIGDSAFIAAGSVITDAVPADALAIARARQAVKENWNKGENN